MANKVPCFITGKKPEVERVYFSDKDWRKILNSVSISFVDVIIVSADGKFLLGKRAIDPFKGMWCFPGGVINAFEEPGETCSREIEEELGLKYESERFDYLDLPYMTMACDGDETRHDSAWPHMLLLSVTEMFKAEDITDNYEHTSLKWFDSFSFHKDIDFVNTNFPEYVQYLANRIIERKVLKRHLH
ncbi:NUDIX hydrolase [bacterium]|nr:NUDIX hydrolase [bacterium]